MDFTYCRAESIEQFRFQNGRQIGARRLNLKYYVVYEENEKTILIQHQITKETDPNFLIKAIKLGAIYLEKFDHEMTLTSIESSKKSVKK